MREAIYEGILVAANTLAEARSLFCFWAVRNLGYAATTAASFLRMTQPGVGYAADRGEAVARRKGFVLGEAQFSYLFAYGRPPCPHFCLLFEARISRGCGWLPS